MTMRRTVYFHIDEIARDAVVAANLRRILNAHDVEVTFGNRANSQLLGLLDNFAAFDLYFFPSIDLFLANCPDVNRLSAPVIILPSETVGGTARNLDRVAAKYFGAFPDECQPWIKKVAAFCVWGPSHLRAFAEKGPELLPKAHVVGHPRFDRRCRPGQPAPGPGKRIRVGLISRFSALNPYDRRGMLQIIYDGRRKMDGRVHPLYRLSPHLNMEDRIFTESMDLRHLFELIDALDPNQYELIVRAHPREDRTRW